MSENKHEIKVKGDMVDFIFIQEEPYVKRVETVPKSSAIELYRQTKKDRQDNMVQLAEVNKRLEKSEIVMDAEMEHFIEMANKAARYNEFKKLEDQRNGLTTRMGLIDKQMHDLETALPELKRAKK